MQRIVKTRIAVAPLSLEQHKRAYDLATQLQLPLTRIDHEQYDHLLVVTDQHLELRSPCFKKSHALCIDFLQGKIAHRQHQGGGRQQLIARAVGLKPNYNPIIIDATAGLGQDGYILANLGCSVILVERSAIFACLLQDGIQRLLRHPSYQHLCLQFIHKNAIDYLQNDLTALPDVIYLDPMYPHSTKSALNRQALRILRNIVGDDNDADKLLTIALTKAKRRVVVKRPRLAPTINALEPTIVYRGKSCRYDVYIPIAFQNATNAS